MPQSVSGPRACSSVAMCSTAHAAAVHAVGIALLLIMSLASAAVPAQRFPSNQEVPTLKGVIDAIRFALVGSPTFHDKQRWEFDPKVSQRRNPEFEALHGHHSVRLIERLGLGEDGREEERRQQQAARDIGVPITGRR